MAMWGGRFAVDTDREMTEFSESISFDKRLYKYDIQGSKAHAAMLAAQQIIPTETAEQIAVELDKIEQCIDQGDFTFTAKLEDIHMHIESALIAAMGDEGARLHSGRSRNDQVALDTRLYLRSEITVIDELLKGFQAALIEQADSNDKTILPGFTHLQHAQPVLFAHHLLAYVEMLQRDRDRLADCAKRINVMPLGAGALAGTTLPLDREFVRKQLGFDAVTRNSMDAVADRDFAIELLSALAICNNSKHNLYILTLQ